MNAADAHAAAAAEGLALVRAETTTGFMGVCRNTGRGKPFKALLCHGGRREYIGCFATAEEAALAVARFLGPERIAAEQAAARDALGRSLPAASAAGHSAAPMTAAEAHAAAAAEGLSLLHAENATGFKGVSYSNNLSKPFKAQLEHGGRTQSLGRFATAEAAALAVARFLGPERVAAALTPAAPAPTMTAAEAHAAAEEEGLTLLRADNSTGFKNVQRQGSGSTPFRAQLRHGGHQHNLGQFATAEEAALAVARVLGPEGVAAALSPPAPEREEAAMTAEEAIALAAAEGLTLVRAENPTGFKHVSRNPRSASKPFNSKLKRGGRHKYLGQFATAAEAALAVARFVGPEGVAAARAAARAASRAKKGRGGLGALGL